jgi:hypothetical protein
MDEFIYLLIDLFVSEIILFNSLAAATASATDEGRNGLTHSLTDSHSFFLSFIDSLLID